MPWRVASGGFGRRYSAVILAPLATWVHFSISERIRSEEQHGASRQSDLRSARSWQRPSFVEGRPVSNERRTSSLKPQPKLLRVDRAQVLAVARAQRTLKPNQIICRTLVILGGFRGPFGRSHDVLRQRSHIGAESLQRLGLHALRLCVGRGNLELGFVRRAARKPTPQEPDLPILKELTRVHLGRLRLRKTIAT